MHPLTAEFTNSIRIFTPLESKICIHRTIDKENETTENKQKVWAIYKKNHSRSMKVQYSMEASLHCTW